MKKLEKLGSKLFEEFRGDEVSELASVIGGDTRPTTRNGGTCDVYDPGTKCTGDSWTGEAKDVSDCGVFPNPIGEWLNVENVTINDLVLPHPIS